VKIKYMGRCVNGSMRGRIMTSKRLIVRVLNPGCEPVLVHGGGGGGCDGGDGGDGGERFEEYLFVGRVASDGKWDFWGWSDGWVIFWGWWDVWSKRPR